MKRRSRDNRLLLIGLAFSIALHVLLVMPWLSTAASTTENRGIVDLVTAIEPPAPEPEKEPVLGLQDSMAKTMNWIGYEEYEKHLARLADTDQAAFKMNPSGGGGATPTSSEPPQDQPSKTQPPPDAAAVDQTPASGELPARLEPSDSEQQGPPAPEPGDGEEPDPKPKEEPTSDPKPQPEPTPEPKPDPGQGPGAGDGDPGDSGDAADRESDPTSIVDVPPEKWRTGKPLAAHGLEMQTRRPQLTPLTLISARFGNPVVEIQFGPNGKPKNALILQSSGDERVDGPILDSLYRWRAKGDRIDELKDDETANIRLRIVLY